MSRAREARRKQERAMARAGVALVCRESLPLQDAPIGAGPSIDALVAYVGETLRALAGGGADLSGTIAITIGQDHPSFLAGQTVIEAKAAKRKAVPAPDGWTELGGVKTPEGVTLYTAPAGTPAPVDDCKGCPVDHSDAGERDE